MVHFKINECKNETTNKRRNSAIKTADVTLTICDKMLRNMEGNLDSERAGVLCSIDNGNDTCADGDQREGDLIQRTV